MKTFLIVLILAIIFFGLRYFVSTDDAPGFIEKVRKSAQPGFDSMNRHIQKENYLRFKIDSMIAKNDFQNALQFLSSLTMDSQTKLDYRGQIAFKQGKFRESLNFFNENINANSYSISVAHRARVYTALKIFDSAISDYKKISYFNYDYFRPLAEAYELAKEKDSALKYYQKFLEHYPDSISVKNKINFLKDSG